jgi:hypothetical protein
MGKFLALPLSPAATNSFSLKTACLGNLKSAIFYINITKEQIQTFSFRMSSASKLIGVSIANRASI